MYFNNDSPFETISKKKYEFPDAFSIDIIKNYLKESINELIVITTDEGVKKSFPNDVQIFRSVNQSLTFLNSMTESIDDINLHLKRIKAQKGEEILGKIQTDMNKIKMDIASIPNCNNYNQFEINPPFVSDVYDYELIGQENDIVYVSVKVTFWTEVIFGTIKIIDQNVNDFNQDEGCPYQDSVTYNLSIKINKIDDYEILDIISNINNNTIYIDYNKIQHTKYLIY